MMQQIITIRFCTTKEDWTTNSRAYWSTKSPARAPNMKTKTDTHSPKSAVKSIFISYQKDREDVRGEGAGSCPIEHDPTEPGQISTKKRAIENSHILSPHALIAWLR